MTNTQPLFWLLRHVRRRIPAMLLMCAAQVGGALFGVLFALGTSGVIDAAVAGEKNVFIRACVAMAGIIAGLLLCQALCRHLREKLNAELDRDWKKFLLHGLLYGDYAAVKQYHSGELLNRINNDVRTVDEGLLNVLPNVLSMLTRLVAAIAVLAALDWRFTLLMTVLGGAVIFGTGFARRHLKVLHKKVSEQEGKVSGFLQETIEKLLLVQAMDIAPEMERRTHALLDVRYEAQRKRKNMSLIANTGVSVVSQGVRFLALVWCAVRLLKGQMSFGSLTAVTQLVSQLQSPMVGLSGVIPQYIGMIASAERLMELEAIEGEPFPMEASPMELYAHMDTVCARGLDFSYDRDSVLRQAAFTLPKGTFAVITGHSGIGKSTLLKLLLGIFRPDTGELYLQCGEKCVPLDRSTRRLFAYVPQGNLLFSGTLRENLTVTAPQATEEMLQQAMFVSAMDEYLPQLPQGLDTPLGESGAGLSEGQAQRLAIARAVLGGAPVLLLDECTSALDAETERKVLQRLCALPERTCIAVTHRPAAIALCDWQLEISDGKIHCIEKKS